MKKLLICVALLASGGFILSDTANATEIASGPTCPPDAPCLYTGNAYADNGAVLKISVHRLNDYTTDLVAKFEVNGKKYTSYVFSNMDGRWYLNWSSMKYYFEM